MGNPDQEFAAEWSRAAQKKIYGDRNAVQAPVSRRPSV